MAERAGLAFTSYESAAEGKLELVDGKFQLTAITLPVSADAAKAKELIEKAEANCLISNSMEGASELGSDYPVAGWGQPGRPPARGTRTLRMRLFVARI